MLTRNKEEIMNHQMNEAQNSGVQKWCSNKGCIEVIMPKTQCFTDMSSGFFYCITCGQRLRYHRKKALERGEKMPIYFSDIEAIK